ncbi:MAG: hypothetical protein K8T10_15415 [Candidatus Eremiobacteraeota bacterium]|nr:hypothetical protein [Candidatus Eremiobacteraeota bacterium]
MKKKKNDGSGMRKSGDFFSENKGNVKWRQEVRCQISFPASIFPFPVLYEVL